MLPLTCPPLRFALVFKQARQTPMLTLPNQIAESELAAQARNAAAQAARTAQAGARQASDSFHRFVEGGPALGGYRQVRNPNTFDESRRSFWDEFAAAADQRRTGGSSIGTSAMGKGSSRQPAAPTPAQGKDKEEWDDW